MGSSQRRRAREESRRRVLRPTRLPVASSLPRLVLGLLAAGLLGPSLLAPAWAADAMIGEAWEGGIVQGQLQQERERQSRSPDALLRQAKLAANRRADPATEVVRLYLLARAYGIAGDAGASVSTYRDVLGRAPRCYFAYHDLAMLDLGREPPDTASAERNLRRAIQVNPGYVTAHRKLAKLHLDGARAGDAVPHLQRVVDLEPQDQPAQNLLVHALIASGRTEEAEKQLARLVAARPSDTVLRSLEADLFLERGHYEEAAARYRRLAAENPAVVEFLRGYLRVLERQRTAGQPVAPADVLWALEGILRLTPDPVRRAELERHLEELRRSQAAPPPSEGQLAGPPTDAQLEAYLTAPREEVRVAAARWIFAREEPPSMDLLRVLRARLGPLAEPSAEVRQWTLRALARHGGFGHVALVRHSLSDPDPTVRPVAADALVRLSTDHEAARGATLLVLGMHLEGPDRALAAVLRHLVLHLARADLGEAPSDPGARTAWLEQAFVRWWRGPEAGYVRSRALETYEKLRDPAAEDVLLHWLLADPDPLVVGAAWRALEHEARRAVDDGRGRRSWLGRLPPFAREAVAPGAMETTRARLAAWAAGRPR